MPIGVLFEGELVHRLGFVAGVATYARRGARVIAGATSVGEATFDRFGALTLALAGAFDYAELAALEVELIAP